MNVAVQIMKNVSIARPPLVWALRASAVTMVIQYQIPPNTVTTEAQRTARAPEAYQVESTVFSSSAESIEYHL